MLRAAFPRAPLRNTPAPKISTRGSLQYRLTSSSTKTTSTVKQAAESASSTAKAAVPAKPALWRRLGPVTRAIDGYTASQKKRPLWTHFVSSLVIFLCGDLGAQNISGAEYDPYRTLRTLILGGVSAIPQYKWFFILSKNFNYQSKALSITAKVLFNQMTFAVAFPIYFFSGQALLAGEGVYSVYERVRDTFIPVWTNSWKVWPLTTAITMTYVPIQYRALFSGFVSIWWQTYMSWMNRQAEVQEETEHASFKEAVVEKTEIIAKEAVVAIA